MYMSAYIDDTLLRGIRLEDEEEADGDAPFKVNDDGEIEEEDDDELGGLTEVDGSGTDEDEEESY
jgi:hypothetical protein